jgi:hypothetical protein
MWSNIVEQVIKFKYLGTEITDNGAQQLEVQHQAHKDAEYLDAQITQHGGINI